MNQFSDSTKLVVTGVTDPVANIDFSNLNDVFILSTTDDLFGGFVDIIYNIDFSNATARWHYEKSITEIRLTSSSRAGNELNVNYHIVHEHRLSIPQEYRHHFDGKSEIVGLERYDTGTPRSLMFASDRRGIAISPDDLAGDWIIPHRYEASPSELNVYDLAQSDDQLLNKIDRFTFGATSAVGQFSGYEYSWQHSQGVLSIERNNDKYEIRPFAQEGQHYQAEFRHYKGRKLQRVYIGRLIKVNNSADSFINNPYTTLPNVWVHSYWHNDSLNADELFEVFMGHHLNSDGTVHYDIRRGYSFTSRSEVFESFRFTTFTLDNTDNSVTIANSEGPDDIWQVLDVDASGKVTILSLDRETFDSNGDGVIDTSETNQPSLFNIEEYVIHDLSRYGSVYDNSTFASGSP